MVASTTFLETEYCFQFSQNKETQLLLVAENFQREKDPNTKTRLTELKFTQRVRSCTGLIGLKKKLEELTNWSFVKAIQM